MDAIAENVAHVSTSGYKRRILFSHLINVDRAIGDPHVTESYFDVRQGALISTGTATDIAISGPGFFKLRHGDEFLFSRQGQFSLDGEGRLVSPQGYVLQQADGGDVVLDRTGFEVAPDGTISVEASPIARIGVFAPESAGALSQVSGGYFAADEGLMVEAAGAVVRQGFTEASNVSFGDEMVAMTAAVREAETGARLVQVYDDLMGRALSSLGRA